MKRTITFLLSITLIFTMMFSLPATVDAASKPAATKITSLTANVKGFTVKWSKKDVDGYQIAYSRSSSFDDANKITIKSSTQTKRRVKGLKAKKKYYVKVRTYKTVKGEKIYSAWSKKRSITTKASSTTYSNVVYITPTGSKYHCSKSCAGPNAIKTTLKEAKASGYKPCKVCAGG